MPELLASKRPWQCWHTTWRPKYSTRTCKLRPQVGHSCTKYVDLDMTVPPLPSPDPNAESWYETTRDFANKFVVPDSGALRWPLVKEITIDAIKSRHAHLRTRFLSNQDRKPGPTNELPAVRGESALGTAPLFRKTRAQFGRFARTIRSYLSGVKLRFCCPAATLVCH